MHDLGIEVERLRTQLRRQRIALVVVACAAVVPIASLRAAGAPAVVDAQRFRLVDAAGNERANLMMMGDTAALGLMDSAGKVRVMFAVGEQTAAHLADSSQRLLLSPGIVSFETNGAESLRLGGTDASTAQVAFLGAAGKPVAVLDRKAFTLLQK
jgi:hypothetical protein